MFLNKRYFIRGKKRNNKDNRIKTNKKTNVFRLVFNFKCMNQKYLNVTLTTGKLTTTKH